MLFRIIYQSALRWSLIVVNLNRFLIIFFLAKMSRDIGSDGEQEAEDLETLMNKMG